jgi:hypothetical protein
MGKNPGAAEAVNKTGRNLSVVPFNIVHQYFSFLDVLIL